MIVKKEKETHLSLYYKQYKLWTQCVTSAYLERKVIKLVCVSVWKYMLPIGLSTVQILGTHWSLWNIFTEDKGQTPSQSFCVYILFHSFTFFQDYTR
jgi:hypothetical protein